MFACFPVRIGRLGIFCGHRWGKIGELVAEGGKDQGGRVGVWAASVNVSQLIYTFCRQLTNPKISRPILPSSSSSVVAGNPIIDSELVRPLLDLLTEKVLPVDTVL